MFCDILLHFHDFFTLPISTQLVNRELYYPLDEPKVKLQFVTEKPTLELVDQIEELHVALLEKLDSINELRSKLRTEYVPTSVCSHIEQCIKETEVRFKFLCLVCNL